MIEPNLLVQDIPSHREARMYAARLFGAANATPNDIKLVSASTTVHIEKREVCFSVPSHAALCLNMAHHAFRRAQELWTPDIIESTTSGFRVEDELPRLYDFFEQMILNVVFSFTAVEAFSNSIIPEDFVFTRVRDDKKCEESYTKEQIERHLSLDVKISEVLPKIIGKACARGSSIWTEYVLLRDRRNRITHVKSADLGITLAGERTIWEELLKLRSKDSSLTAHKIIKFFVPAPDDSTPVSATRNNWVKSFPFNNVMKTSGDQNMPIGGANNAEAITTISDS